MSEDQIYCFNLLNNTNKSKIMLDVKNKSHEQIEDCETIWDVHQIHCKKKKKKLCNSGDFSMYHIL